MTAAGVEGQVGGRSDGGGSAAWQPPAAGKLLEKRAHYAGGQGPMERVRSTTRTAYQVCKRIGILSAEGNAATVTRDGGGMGREGNGHDI